MIPNRLFTAVIALIISGSISLFAQDLATPPTWTSKDGRIIQAKFVKLDGEAVVVQKDGKDVTISFAKLTAESVAKAKELSRRNSQTSAGNDPKAHENLIGPPLAGTSIKVALPNGVEMNLCGIPSGTYKFTIARGPAEAPLSGLWLGKNEVTQAEWEAVMGNNPSAFRGMDLPVENVNWDDARAFVAKLNKIAPLADGWSWSLPTWSQWSYACYAGESSCAALRKTKFHFGDTCNGSQANVDGSKPVGTDEKGPNLGKTTPVGSYPPNVWGLHDMHGNVAEWCRDSFAVYGMLGNGIDLSPKDPRIGKDPLVSQAFTDSFRPGGENLYRTTVGGSWSSGAEEPPMNGGGRPTPFSERSSSIGLRVAIVTAEVAAKPD